MLNFVCFEFEQKKYTFLSIFRTTHTHLQAEIQKLHSNFVNLFVLYLCFLLQNTISPNYDKSNRIKANQSTNVLCKYMLKSNSTRTNRKIVFVVYLSNVFSEIKWVANFR